MANNIVPVASTQTPYYDDFDPSKGYHRILFRPGYAVQARELTQSQTIQQNQIANFGDHVFTDGSLVQGGQVSLYGVTTLNLKSTYANTAIDISNYANNQVINVNTASAIVRAQVVDVAASSDTEPDALIIKYLTGDEFAANATLRVSGEGTFANVAATNPTGNGVSVSIQDGIFYVGGYFVQTEAQTITLEKYSTTPTYRVGLEINKEIIDESSDTSLLDPAQEASNYQAPGATRYKISLSLAKRSLASTDDSAFIELMRVENGLVTKQVLYPVYSEIEKTLARRTFDESGNYTVDPFVLQLRNHANLSNSMVATLDPGKAYVQGFEFQTIAPTNLLVRRARDYINVANYDVATTYGNYLLVGNVNTSAGATSGMFNLASMQSIDLHAVPVANIATANTTVYNGSKIGTARVRSITYESAANTDNSDTHVYRLYVFNTDFSSLSGNANTATATTLQLANTANGTDVINYAGANDAYIGATLTITTGTAEGYSGSVTAYDSTTRTVTLSPSFSPHFSTPTGNSVFRLGFDVHQVESLATGTTSLTSKANIVNAGKVGLLANGETTLFESDYNNLVFPLPQSPIRAGAIADQNYSYRKTFTSRTFTNGVGSITAGTGESFSGSGLQSSTAKLSNYIVVITNKLASNGISNGEILSFTNSGRTVNVSGNTVTFDSGLSTNTFTADIVATINIDTGSETNPKVKTKVSANTTAIDSGSANGTIGNTSVYLPTGQIRLLNSNKTPGGNDSLYIADVTKLTKVYDFGTNNITTANIASATDITTKYTLDNGQRDNLYDHAAIILKSGTAAPTGNVLVCVDYYNHGSGTSDGLGYFSVDSYPDASTDAGYANVATYYSASSGRFYYLRDCIDFRPKRQNASSTYPDFTIEGIRVPVPNDNFSLDYSYYIPRIDKIILTKDRSFTVIGGTSNQYPLPPNDLDYGMTMYTLRIPAYTFATSNVAVTYHEHKRYTMRDIGALEKRINNLEYYSALSLLEQQATNQTILDSDGIDRVKYGTLVDSFKGHNIGDVQNQDYVCSIDYETGEMRPAYASYSTRMGYAGSSGTTRNGDVITLAYTQEPVITQNTASGAVAVNDFLIARFLGTIRLNPDSDYWKDTGKVPVVIINTNGENDNWETIGRQIFGVSDNRNPFNTRWNEWQSMWTGIAGVTADTFNPALPWWDDTISREAFLTSDSTIQSPLVKKSFNVETIVKSLFDGKTTDIGVVPFMRSRVVYFVGEAFRSNKVAHFFFDLVNVDAYVQRANELEITYGSNVAFTGSPGVSETVTANNGLIAQAILSWPQKTVYSGNTRTLYVSEVTGNGNVIIGGTVTGNISGATGTIVSYNHYSGRANATNPGTSNTITLQDSASTTSNIYAGNTISLVWGSGAGEAKAIISYNATSKVATVNSNWTTTPTSNTRYSIGEIKTLSDGVVTGTFMIPDNNNLVFRTGERIFRITDSATNNFETSTTSGDAIYRAAGFMEMRTEETTRRSFNKNSFVPQDPASGAWSDTNGLGQTVSDFGTPTTSTPDLGSYGATGESGNNCGDGTGGSNSSDPGSDGGPSGPW